MKLLIYLISRTARYACSFLWNEQNTNLRLSIYSFAQYTRLYPYFRLFNRPLIDRLIDMCKSDSDVGCFSTPSVSLYLLSSWSYHTLRYATPPLCYPRCSPGRPLSLFRFYLPIVPIYILLLITCSKNPNLVLYIPFSSRSSWCKSVFVQIQQARLVTLSKYIAN